MKRYWLFECQQYYPYGGMSDYIGDYDTIEQAEGARSVTFNPAETYEDIKGEAKEIESGVTAETYYKLRSKYNAKMNEWAKRDTSYHILDILEGKIVAGWDGNRKEVIPEQSIGEFKDKY